MTTGRPKGEGGRGGGGREVLVHYMNITQCACGMTIRLVVKSSTHRTQSSVASQDKASLIFTVDAFFFFFFLVGWLASCIFFTDKRTSIIT